jgi:prepilin-type processing-associated H-X9-DG protein
VQGGFGKPHTSPHLIGNLPAGGNLGMLDGHVEWRKFQDMQIRSASGPFFWW